MKKIIARFDRMSWGETISLALSIVTATLLCILAGATVQFAAMDWNGTLEGLSWTEKILDREFAAMHRTVLFFGAATLLATIATAITARINRKGNP